MMPTWQPKVATLGYGQAAIIDSSFTSTVDPPITSRCPTGHRLAVLMPSHEVQCTETTMLVVGGVNSTTFSVSFLMFGSEVSCAWEDIIDVGS